jgi:hypothetical protein
MRMPQLSVGRALIFLSVALTTACDADTGADDITAGSGGAGAGGNGGTGGSGMTGGSAGQGTGGTSGTGTGGTGGTGGATMPGGSGGAGPAGTGGTGTGGSAAGAAGSGAASAAGGSAGSGVSGSGGTAAGTGGSGGMPVFDRTPEGTCARWNADRADMGEGSWSGNVASCTVGDISPEGRANALRLFNLYRWLADLPEVTTSPDRDQMAQECALMQAANWREEGLSHEPPDTWLCYTELGAEGSSTSNISGGPGVSSVDAYMIDTGNETTFGHRRIILSNWLGPIGLGSTGPSGASCMQNIGGDGDAGKEWVAWPPPGPFPIQAYSRQRGSYSDTGWSVQSEDIDVRNATVTVTTSGGMTMPVTASALTGNYGSTRGLRILPDDWDPVAGETYTVTLGNVTPAITYAIQMVDCEP